MENNKYTKLQKDFYKKGTTNHEEHNNNQDYWDILLGGDFVGGNALDFGCGKGRNVTNLKDRFQFDRVDGVDISESNISYCKSTIDGSDFYLNNGIDLKDLKSNEYDLVMSTIVLQHIPVHEIRYNLMSEIHRVLKNGGEFRFQMGYGNDLKHYNGGNDRKGYYENFYEATGTNGVLDVRITNENDIKNDLSKIGFKNIKTIVKDSYSDSGHPKWIYVTCNK